MKVLRALGFGALLWVFLFFEVSVLMFGLKLEQGSTNFLIIHYIAVTLLLGIASLLYFRGKGIRAGFCEGVIAGFLFLIAGLVLDSIITIPLFILPAGGSYGAFFLTSWMLLGYLETLVVPGVIGLIKTYR